MSRPIKCAKIGLSYFFNRYYFFAQATGKCDSWNGTNRLEGETELVSGFRGRFMKWEKAGQAM